MTKTIYIKGMTCSHCVMRITKVLENIDGVILTNVSLDEKRATIESNKDIDEKLIIKSIESLGYSVEKIE